MWWVAHGIFLTEKSHYARSTSMNSNKLIRQSSCYIPEVSYFGDLREANLLIENGTGDVKVVDFGWYGTEGKVYYPANLNCDGRIGSAITKQHDLSMLELLRPRNT